MNRLKRFHVDTRFSRISSRKRKISRNRFCLFIWGPCRVFLSRKMYRKSRFTVPLNGQSRICLYFKESSTVLTVKVRACHLYNFKKCLVIAVCFYACSQCCITITLIKLPRMVGSGLQRNCQQLLDPDYK